MPAIACVLTNAICEIANASIPFTQAANMPFRIWSLHNALFKQRSKTKAYYQIVAMTAIALPYGRLISIAIDAACEFYCTVYATAEKETPVSLDLPAIDPKIKANALTILDLTEDEAKDFDTVIQKRDLIVQELTKKLAKASPIIRESLYEMIRDANAACKTLTDEV